jgi:tRNA (cmo5U34)-methyltransferase
MQREEVEKTFNNMAETYDQQWERLAPINDSLHLLMGGVFSNLPAQANVLCVGAGTGAEIIYLAKRFPQWTFTAVDPSTSMLEVCRKRLRALDIENRCKFHSGYLESLPSFELFDAATSLLVSQFILDKESRSEFFKLIAKYLKPEGILVSSDLSADLHSANYPSLLQTWLELMKEGGVPAEGLEGMRKAYGKNVAVLPDKDIAALIQSGGFDDPIRFFQLGLIHAWYSVKAAKNA